MEKLKDLWANRNVRLITVMSVIGLVVIFIAMSMTDDKDSQLKRIQQMQDPQVRDGSLFGASGSINQISEQDASNIVDRMTREIAQRETELASREKLLRDENQKNAERTQQMEQQMLEMRQQLLAIQRGHGTVTADARVPRQGGRQAQSAQPDTAQQRPMYDAQGNLINQNQTQIITQAPMGGLPGSGQVIRTVTQRSIREFKDGQVNERPVEIHTLNARTQNASAKPAIDSSKVPLDYEEEAGAELFTLSMGSIISGTLLNGVAAPTSSDRKEEPMPVLMRIRRESIMPNNFTIDLIDCHILGSAIGDLSSSRAYIRAEAISCNTQNGEAIEKSITAYAVSSSDGLAGIEGDVVFKSGAMIANSLKAEFIRGFADAFSPKRVQSLNTSPGASELWQTQNLDRAAGAGVGQGFSGAATRIADYYMDMADASHPVIELVPGIEVDFIVQRGMTLRLGGREAPYTGNRMEERQASTGGNRLPGANVSVQLNGLN